MLYRVIVSGEIAKIALRENDLREEQIRKLSLKIEPLLITNSFPIFKSSATYSNWGISLDTKAPNNLEIIRDPLAGLRHLSPKKQP